MTARLVLIILTVATALSVSGCAAQILDFSAALQCMSAPPGSGIQSPPPALCERLRRQGLVR